MLGLQDWNELSAKIQSESQPPDVKPSGIIRASAIGSRTDLPTVALWAIVLFPQMIVPFFVGRYSTKRAIEPARRSAYYAINSCAAIMLAHKKTKGSNPSGASYSGRKSCDDANF
jgi:hypothetical protein